MLKGYMIKKHDIVFLTGQALFLETLGHYFHHDSETPRLYLFYCLNGAKTARSRSLQKGTMGLCRSKGCKFTSCQSLTDYNFVVLGPTETHNTSLEKIWPHVLTQSLSRD